MAPHRHPTRPPTRRQRRTHHSSGVRDPAAGYHVAVYSRIPRWRRERRLRRRHPRDPWGLCGPSRAPWDPPEIRRRSAVWSAQPWGADQGAGGAHHRPGSPAGPDRPRAVA